MENNITNTWIPHKRHKLISILLTGPLSTAKISSPVSDYYLVRNPRYANQGKFLKLSDFLAIVMDSELSGAMIIIEVIPSLEVLLILIWSHRIELSTWFLSLSYDNVIPVCFVQKKHDYLMCQKVHQIVNIIIFRRRHNLYKLLQRLCVSLMPYQISY